MHERYHEGLKTGCIQYEIEVITPLHISAGKKESGKEKEDSEEESTREEELFKILLGNMLFRGIQFVASQGTTLPYFLLRQ